MMGARARVAAGQAAGAAVGRLLARALRFAAPLYLATLALAAVPTAIVIAAAHLAAGNRPWRTGLLDPSWLNLVVEALGEVGAPSSYVDDTRLRAGLLLILLGLLVGVVALILNGVVYAFLAGGILERLQLAVGPVGGAHSRVPPLEQRATDERSSVGVLRGRRMAPGFWVACRCWFWPFVRLGLLGMVVYGVLAVAAALLLMWLQRVLTPTVAFVLQVAWLSLLAGWLELARAWMVRCGDRAAWHGLRAATQLTFHPRPPIIWLALALPSIGLLLVQTWMPFVGDPSSPLAILGSLLAAQVTAFAGAWFKVVRLGIALRLVPAVLSEHEGAPSPDGRWTGSELSGRRPLPTIAETRPSSAT
ncbi:MAG: hypothetical protein IT305_31250 [Chloroflexi bacterium]|nr:hypothetical protein [Chloroflexota bacterium]